MKPRLRIGIKGRVETGGLPNRVRNSPSLSAENLFQLQPNAEFAVIGGPQCGNGYVWWQIEASNGRIGWTVESEVASQDYYVEPVNSGLGITNGQVNHQGVHFNFPNNLASDVTFEVIPAVADPDGQTLFGGSPEYREFSFIDFVTENAFDPPLPRIRIYPTKDLFTYNEFMFQQWVDLSAVLQDQTLYTSDTIITTLDNAPLPALPLRNAAQVFATQIRYVEFQNGVGIRYITRYAQAPMGTANDMLFYTFQGLTYDNQFYVVMDIPIEAVILPETFIFPAENTNVDWDTFYQQLQAQELALYDQLALLNPADFTPGLTILDGIIASLEVK
jgi:hypothetical protein